MNANKLHTSIDCIAYSGQTLSIEQWIVLSNSLTLLQTENHFKNVYLWGLISGQEADYYIAYGYEKDALIGRKFFYSSNNLEWVLLPETTEMTKKLTEICFQRFQGDPALVVDVVDDDPGPSPEEIASKRKEICLAGGDPNELLLEPPGIGVAQLKEEDRLAATVEFINHEAVVLPRGVLLKTPDGTVIENSAYQGLDPDLSNDLKFYFHYRKPLNKWSTNLLTRHDYDYGLDFLDTIDKDLPQGCWTIQKERGERLCILKNLYWPGFTAYHWCNTPEWGFLYYGNGRKDLDVPFMLFA